MIFLLSHVLGYTGNNILPENLTLPLLEAVAVAQLILLAVKGQRSYTKQELKVIFDHGFVSFFTAIERVRELHYQNLTQHALQQSEPPPKRFKRLKKNDSGTDDY